MEMFDLKGKVAMITGSSKGLGEAAAVALAKAGASIAICGRNEGDIDKTVERLTSLGYDCAGFVVEVTREETVKKGVAAILNHFGRIDILVNNAGVNHRVPIVEFPEEEWDRVIDTNLKGYYLVAKAVAPQMIERGYGKVINMSSILGRIGLP